MSDVRALSFGAAAADYDRYRPRYPDALVDDVVAMTPGRQLLEVGAGTGIATAAFLARGMELTCVEPDPGMAAVLTAKCPDARVEVATFEEWSGGGTFDGLVSGQAWHWTDPATRWERAAAALRPGGVVALFWNQDNPADPRVLAAFTAAYDRHGVEVRTVRAPEEHEPPLEMNDDFTDQRSRFYRWTHRIPVADYIARVNTTSAHLVLPAEVRDALTAETTAALLSYGDEVELAMVTLLITAVRRPA